jgi:dephospho-CoA kinase
MHLFGLTGGIASGKSTVAQRLASRGVPVLDADAFAREVVRPGSDALREIRDAFGAAMVQPDGSLDRKALASVVFSDTESRRTLNGITHPRIAALTAERARELSERGEPLACYEAALLVESGLSEAFRPLVVVIAPEELRVARAMQRDGATSEAARARIATQGSQSELLRVADFVISNDADLSALDERTDGVLAEICRRVGLSPGRYGLDPSYAASDARG